MEATGRENARRRRDGRPARTSSLAAAVLAAALCSSAPSPAPATEGADLLEGYRPGKGSRPGSLGSPDFRRRAAAAIWASTLSAPPEESLRKFVAARVSRGKSPSQLVISTPGSALPETPLSPEEASDIFADRGMVSQVSAQLLDPSRPLPGRECAGSLERDADLRDLVASSLSPLDFPPGVLSVLCELRRAATDREWKAHRRLALAIALVHDQAAPPEWPHSQVPRACLPQGEMTPVEKFRDLVEAQRAGVLKSDLESMEVGDLVHLVDHRLPVEELEWLRRRYGSAPRQRLASRAFADVRYDTARESSGSYDWPEGEPYTAANIARRGGICVDQAFYASMACKALGVPAAAFAGAGDEGGHAWVGFLGDSGWNFSVGRPEGKYIVGRFAHPQGWVQMSDHDMEGEISAPPLARMEMWLSRIFSAAGDDDRARQAADAAASMAPQSPSIWRERDAALRVAEQPSETTRRLKDELRRTPMPATVKSEARMDLAEMEMQRGNATAAKAQARAALKETAGDRADLGVEQMAAAVRRQVDAGRAGPAMTEYRKSVASVPEGSRGEYFYAVVVPLVNSLVEGNNRPMAVQAAKLARRHLSPPKGSLLDRELKEVEDRAGRSGSRRSR